MLLKGLLKLSLNKKLKVLVKQLMTLLLIDWQIGNQHTRAQRARSNLIGWLAKNLWAVLLAIGVVLLLTARFFSLSGK